MAATLWQRAAVEAAAIVGLAAAWGLGWNAVDPRGVAVAAPLPARAARDPRYLTHAAARTLYHRSAQTVFVDVRPLAAWRAGHVPGAVHVPANDFAAAWERAGARLADVRDLVLYCDSAHCDLAERVRPRFLDLGIPRVRIYGGGWAAWEAAGEPVKRGDEE